METIPCPVPRSGPRNVKPEHSPRDRAGLALNSLRCLRVTLPERQGKGAPGPPGCTAGRALFTQSILNVSSTPGVVQVMEQFSLVLEAESIHEVSKGSEKSSSKQVL